MVVPIATAQRDPRDTRESCPRLRSLLIAQLDANFRSLQAPHWHWQLARSSLGTEGQTGVRTRARWPDAPQARPGQARPGQARSDLT